MSDGGIEMVDISSKPVTLREAVVEARISLLPRTIKLIRNNGIPKGDVLALAKCAGICAAKKTDELIPLCHSLPLEHVEITCKLKTDAIVITVRCKASSKTGVEMEAMVAASVSALAIYDMCKSVDRSAVIEEIKLIEKRGGRSGHYKRK